MTTKKIQSNFDSPRYLLMDFCWNEMFINSDSVSINLLLHILCRSIRVVIYQQHDNTMIDINSITVKTQRRRRTQERNKTHTVIQWNSSSIMGSVRSFYVWHYLDHVYFSFLSQVYSCHSSLSIIHSIHTCKQKVLSLLQLFRHTRNCSYNNDNALLLSLPNKLFIIIIRAHTHTHTVSIENAACVSLCHTHLYKKKTNELILQKILQFVHTIYSRPLIFDCYIVRNKTKRKIFHWECRFHCLCQLHSRRKRRQDGRQTKVQWIVPIAVFFHKEFPREELAGDFPWCPERLRGTRERVKSREDGCFNQSDCKHWSSDGLSDERMDKHCSINLRHSEKKSNIGQHHSFWRDTFSFVLLLLPLHTWIQLWPKESKFYSTYLRIYYLENSVDIWWWINHREMEYHRR